MAALYASASRSSVVMSRKTIPGFGKSGIVRTFDASCSGFTCGSLRERDGGRGGRLQPAPLSRERSDNVHGEMPDPLGTRRGAGADAARLEGELAARAIREDAQVAAFAGKDVFALKVQAFAIGGGIAGLAGALYAHYTSYIVPEIYVPLLTIYIFLALTAGGLANTWGATLGAFAIVFCLESTRFLIGVIPGIGAERLAALREFLVGLCLLLVLLYQIGRAHV